MMFWFVDIYIDEYVQHSGRQGPTLQFMNGTDAKDIVIERLVWKEINENGVDADQANEDSKEDHEEKDEESMDNHNHNRNCKIDMDDGASICSDDLLDLSDITQTLKGNELDKDKMKSTKKRKKEKSLEKIKIKKKGKKKDKSTKKKKQKQKKKKDKKDKDKSSKKSKKTKKKKDKAKSKEKNKNNAKDTNGDKLTTTNHWIHSTIVATEPPMKKRKIDFQNVF